jgi:hypothetical protein
MAVESDLTYLWGPQDALKHDVMLRSPLVQLAFGF